MDDKQERELAAVWGREIQSGKSAWEAALAMVEAATQRIRENFVAYARSPPLHAWRATSPHGFSRVYAETDTDAVALGAMAQRCNASKVHVSRWPEEDLTRTHKP